MAVPKTMNGTQLLVKLGDAASPEQFTHTCLINASRGIQFTSNTNDIVVPDCADPDAAAWIERAVDGLQAQITGAGVVGTDLLGAFWDWFESTTPKNIQVAVNVPLADGGGHWAMTAVLSEFQVTGERSNKAQFSCTILSDGAVTWVDASA